MGSNLDKERRALAAMVAQIDATRDRRLKEINPPMSFYDCERERFQRGIVIAQWNGERHEALRELVKYIAADQRDGVLILRDPTREDAEKAAQMVAEELTTLDRAIAAEGRR